MKNKEVLSGIIGGSFFATTFLALGIPIVPSLVVGAFAFLGGELIMSKTPLAIFDKVDETNVNKVLSDAKNKNKYILDMIPKIDDVEIQNHLKSINNTTSKIINTVDKNKKKIKQTEKFWTYYLPITVEIVSKYDEIENQKLSSKESKEFFRSAHESLDEINTSFKKILDNLYESDIENATADMKVLNNILKADGFHELHVNKEEKNE